MTQGKEAAMTNNGAGASTALASSATVSALSSWRGSPGAPSGFSNHIPSWTTSTLPVRQNVSG
jgi:hypothetical protein